MISAAHDCFLLPDFRRFPYMLRLYHLHAAKTLSRGLVPQRAYSTPARAASTAIYHSCSTNPWFNLAFEDWIFRHTPASQTILFVYRNSPCVVIGRNQNPWKEINLTLLRKLNVPFVRRRSGGGTVYHDLGNTNYCVFMPRTQFERRTNALLVSDALNNLDINTYVNDRNDICIDGYKIGSAFKLVQARAYHHGTMLIDAKLQDLRGVLSNQKQGMVSKGVESVPSPVRNLREWDSFLDHDSFFQAVADQFTHVYGGDRNVHQVNEAEELEKKQYVKDVFDELQTWEWQWGQTPEFSHQMEAKFDWGDVDIDITAHHGIIREASLTSSQALASAQQAALAAMQDALTGQRYEDLSSLEKLVASTDVPESKAVYRDVTSYLRSAM